MFNWLTPLTHIISSPESSIPFASAASITSPTLMHRFLHTPPPVLLDLFNAIADDIATLSKLGLLGVRIGHRAGRLADWFWFASTLAGLVEVGAERAMVKGMLHECEHDQNFLWTYQVSLDVFPTSTRANVRHWHRKEHGYLS